MIKRIGNTLIQGKHRASCHCGAVVLELSLPDGVVDPRRCDCSLCRRRGAIVASVPVEQGVTIRRWRIVKRVETKSSRIKFEALEGNEDF